MNNARENIKTNNFYSFLMILILSFGLLIWYNSSDPPASTGHLVKLELSASSHDALLSSGAEFQAFNKEIVFQSKKLFQLSVAGIHILENRRTEQIIAILRDAGRNTDNIPSIYFRYHLFHFERDDLPP